LKFTPAPSLGRRFFIDHGAGVVIGETAEIGDDVLMYQGVVLGGTSLSKGKRHPTIGNKVVIGTGAVVLGNITVGDGAKIGSGSVVIKPVPPGVTVVGVPGRVVQDGHKGDELEHGRLPDPIAEVVVRLTRQQDELRAELRRLEANVGLASIDEQLEREVEDLIGHGAGI
jgi:serine O-acetyltransferase